MCLSRSRDHSVRASISLILLLLVSSFGQETASDIDGRIAYAARHARACCNLLIFVNKKLQANEILCNETKGALVLETIDDCDNGTEKVSAYAVECTFDTRCHELPVRCLLTSTAELRSSTNSSCSPTQVLGPWYGKFYVNFLGPAETDTQRRCSCSTQEEVKRWIHFEGPHVDHANDGEAASSGGRGAEEAGGNFILRVGLQVFSEVEPRYAYGVLTTFDCFLMIFLDDNLLVGQTLNDYAGNTTLYRHERASWTCVKQPDSSGGTFTFSVSFADFRNPAEVRKFRNSNFPCSQSPEGRS
eukprot:759317-Hanusia_phi.AAC.3